MGFIEQLGINAANAGMGMALSHYNDRRQREQQQDLQNIQIRGNKQMMDYSMMKQMEMWKNTNFAAQIAQMKLAGLSPGLIYGMKGGGGITTGSPGGQVTGGTAPVGGQEIPTMIGQGMNLQLLQAQKDLLKAQADNLNADTKNKPIQGQKLQTEILDLTQGIENKQAQQKLTEVQTHIQEIQKRIATATEQEAIGMAVAALGKAQEEVMQLEIKTFIDRATQNDLIDTIKAELAGTLAHNALIKAQTTTEHGKPAQQTADIELKRQQITTMVREGIQKWRELEIQGRKIGIEETKELRDEMKTIAIPENIIDDIINGIILKNVLSPKSPATKPKKDWRFYRKTDDIENVLPKRNR